MASYLVMAYWSLGDTSGLLIGDTQIQTQDRHVNQLLQVRTCIAGYTHLSPRGSSDPESEGKSGRSSRHGASPSSQRGKSSAVPNTPSKQSAPPDRLKRWKNTSKVVSNSGSNTVSKDQPGLKTSSGSSNLEASLMELSIRTKNKGQTSKVSKLQRTQASNQSRSATSQDEAAGSSEGLPSRVDQNSGARLRSSTAHASPKTAILPPPTPARPKQLENIDHEAWLANVAHDILVSKENAQRQPTYGKRRPTAKLINDQKVAKEKKDDARAARHEATRISVAGSEILNKHRASSPTSQTELRKIDSANKKAFVVTALHAVAERDAAETASNTKRWSVIPKHIEASARAQVRAHARETYNNAFQAQHKSVADREIFDGMPAGHAAKVAAQNTANSSSRSFRNAADEYRATYGEYKKTRNTLPGSSSEDEEEIFGNTV